MTDEIRRTVNAAIEQLPEDLKTAIVLRELDGLSYEEIAAAMDCPVGTVRSRIFRAREAIDRRLRELPVAGPPAAGGHAGEVPALANVKEYESSVSSAFDRKALFLSITLCGMSS